MIIDAEQPGNELKYHVYINHYELTKLAYL